MRVLGYIRVSTGNQGAGLDAQRTAIEREVAQRGWELTRMITDDGASAVNLQRPGIQDALDCMRSGGADVLMISKMDRLSRSLLDFVALCERARLEKWQIVALDCSVDTTTPAGEMILNVLASFAQFERRLISQRTKDALAVKKAQGVRLGRPRTMPDEVRVRLATLYKAGMSVTAIAEVLNDENVPTAQGGRQWWPATVRAALQAA